jgi:hypothetical protein
VLKIALFLVSAVPVFLLVKSLLFKRHSGMRVAVSNFNKQVGYLAAGIATLLVVLTLYHFASAWLR